MMRPLLLSLLFALGFLHADAQSSHQVQLLCNWGDTTGIRPVASQYFNDCWGFTEDGVEYGVIGSTEGAHIIRVADCQQVAFYPGRSRNTFHRDFRVYQNYLYAVADEGPATLQVFDLTPLPDSLHLVWETPVDTPLLVHTLWIDTATARLYLNTARSNFFGVDYLRVYSLANPAAPVLTHSLNQANGLPDKIHSSFARNDTAYLSASNYGFVVGTFDSADQFQVITAMSQYPDKGYNHSSYVHTDGIGIMIDETHGMAMKVINTSSLPQIFIESLFSPCSTDSCLPHNVYMIGRKAFISHYYQGFQLYDLANPTAPVQLGWYDTYAPPAQRGGYAGAWGVYPYLPSGKVLVSDMQTGLYVLDASQALSLSPDATVPESRVRLFPNPASDVVELQLSAPTGSSHTLQVFELVSGRTLLTRVLPPGTDQLKLPLPAHWPPMLYGIRVQSPTGSQVLRFSKKD